MKKLTAHAERFMRSTIKSHFSPYSVERPSQSTGAMGGTESSTSITVDMWVFDPREVREDTEFGDRLSGSLGGLTAPTADIQSNDRLTYHGDTYEIAETMTYDGGSDVYLLIDLVRMENTQ